ncbi:kinesin heavy chain-like isoform X2 [Mizuhopecten yessoensis]|uniref:Kinesin-like protein KIF6 n=1 Tax=Mizuhopecten yessoensis TaxID=6573 RepID=A0A210QWM6_MIZYE|nr:kinesin heavy chain-like isoform X2 [Mizuhopecten yessoensis]OWF53096.1 Kinesin-like protein KIF6 [Mizuhopecten yessoensis]
MPQIKTFCRIKPTPDYYPEFEVSQETLYLRVPEVLRDFTSSGKSRGAVISHEFKFSYIFNNTATQEEVFDVAAKDIVEGFLNGYNGTIFAYGQTGTGKTFTVEGGSKSYAHRGLQPRALSMIYKELEKRQDEDISIHISYLEIYKEVGYDLLNPGARTQSVVTPFPKVNVLEGAGGVWVVRNLSVHYAASEDVAQNLLLQGQANRRVAATTVHDRSSRSHAVFTVQLSAKQPNSDVIIKSKLHLVDLAGSERVSKTGVQGNLLDEARSINLSLHFLETVIISLQGESTQGNKRIGSAGLARSQSFRHSRHGARPSSADLSTPKHVPYRNSLLTMVLRDSLGGNCLTAMIATTSLEIENIGESISTCRFAGRVACIANSVSRNEEVDEKTLIKKLRKRVAELETELSCIRAARESGTNFSIEEMNAKLTDEDKILCGQVVSRYLGGQLNDPVTAGITSPYKFRECLKILKRVITDGNHNMLDNNYPQITGVPDGYHSADEVVGHQRKEKISREQPSKRRTEPEKLGREKTVDFPITTNAWESQEVKAQSKPRPPPRVRQHPPRNVTDTNGTQHPGIPVVDDLAQTDTEETKETPQEDRVKPERTLSDMLVSKSRRSKYQSPFEQKRVKEIKKLNNKVETLQQAQIEKEGELVEMKIGLAEQELNIVEEQIRNKLNVTKEQVDDQHAYVAQLETTEADRSLIEREKLVEKQLRRRQNKFDKKLEVLEAKRNQLQQHSEEFHQELDNVEKPTVKEQYGKYRNRDGSLNTRQVFEMLKTKEKKQEKVHTEIDHEKAWIYNKHLEMREAATREKLKQFKEMLRMSRTADARGYVSEDEGRRGANTAPGHFVMNGDHHVPQDRERVKTSDVHPGTQQTTRTQHTAPSEPPGTRQTTRTQHTAPSEPPGTRQTTRTNFTTVPYNDIPQTRQTVRTEYTESSINNNVPGTSQTNRTTGSQFDERPGSSKSMRSIPDSDFYAQKKRDKDPTSRWESSYSRPSTAQSVRFDLGNGQAVLPNGIPVDNGVWMTNNGVGMTDDFKSSSHKSEQKRTAYEPEPEIVNGYESDPRDTVMPSEYVYGMEAGDKFDGRKMGLSSQTFDAALANMLERENQNVYYDNDDYDQYARTSGQPKTNSRKPRVQSPYYTTPYPLSGSSKQPRDVRQGRSPVRKGRSPDRRGMSQERGRGQGSRSHDRAGGSRERAGGSRERQTNWSDDEAVLESLMRAKQQQQSRGRSRDRSKSQERSEVKHSQEDSDWELWPNSRNTKAWGPEARQASIHAKLGMQTPEKKQRRKPRKRTKAKRTLDENLAVYDESNLPGGKKGQLVWEEAPVLSQVTALPEEKAEDVFMTKVQEQKDRVSKIRKARASAEIIQRTWRRFAAKKKVQKMRKAVRT